MSRPGREERLITRFFCPSRLCCDKLADLFFRLDDWSESGLITRFFGSPYLRIDKLADLFSGLGERPGSRKAPRNSIFFGSSCLWCDKLVDFYLLFEWVVRVGGECLVNRIFPKGDCLRDCWCRFFSRRCGRRNLCRFFEFVVSYRVIGFRRTVVRRMWERSDLLPELAEREQNL